MTISSEQQITGFLVRAVYREMAQPLSLTEAVRRLQGVEILVWTAAVAEMNDLQVRRHPEDLPVASVVRQSLDEADKYRHHVNIRHLSYSSPLEILLALPPAIHSSLAVGSSILIGNRLIKLWNNFQKARVNTALASHDVKAYQYLAEQIGADDRLTFEAMEKMTPINVQENLQEGARTLSNLDTIESE